MKAPGLRLLLAALVLAPMYLTGCTTAPEEHSSVPAPLCASNGVELVVGFPAAGHHACDVGPGGVFHLRVMPEETAGPPVNPSPWYAFALNARHVSDVVVELQFGAYQHRYDPYLRLEGEEWRPAAEGAVALSEDKDAATLRLRLKPGRTTVAGQPLLTAQDSLQPMDRLVASGALRRVQYGTSLEGRALYAYEAGAVQAPLVVVAMARQHPPEITGAEAFTGFVDEIMHQAPPDFWNTTALILVPVVNPDGVDAGNWRLNSGGVDLNRDWFDQTQPEIIAVTAFLRARAGESRTFAFLDFHSTWRTLIYSPPFDNESPYASFLPALQAALETGGCGPPEWIFGHNADRGTSKAWALQTLGAPGVTIEFGDNEDRDALKCAAREIASAVLSYADELSNLPPIGSN